MLPHKLSNGICSLNAGEDRLTLSCVMEIDADGNVVSHNLTEGIIRVGERMTYDVVADLLTNPDSPYTAEYAGYMPMLVMMGELAAILREKRVKRGAIDFSFTECKIIVDSTGKAVDIIPSVRNVATGVIEEFMLVCNETVAERFFHAETPFVYRTHETPDAEKMERLTAIACNLGYKYSKKNMKAVSSNLQSLLADVSGTPEEAFIHKLALRSMKQARYTAENTGHFGLAAKYYCHFTSPIRRYPDLQIHRIIKESIHGFTKQRAEHYESILGDICRRCSQTERNAEEAERESNDMKKAEYMESKIGSEYDGIISGVTSWGIFVELPNTVEGMVSISDIPGRLTYDERNVQLISSSSHSAHSAYGNPPSVYRLGDAVRVRVISANAAARKINFVLA